MTLLGYSLHDLTAEQVQKFLDGAEAEPLLWEAKGTSLDTHDVRREVCGFANGHQVAYLILGASRDNGKWVLEGFDFKDDPPAWVSAVVADGLRPVPLVDVASIPIGNNRHLAIIEVPPITITPCICRGTVYERVSGRTIPVKEPARLAELYKRGQNARALAMTAASAAAGEVIDDGAMPGSGSAWPRIALAVSATGHPPDISSRLFSPGYEKAMEEIIRRLLIPPIGNVPPPFEPTMQTAFAQSNRSADCEDRQGHGRPCYWHARVIWDGTVVIYGAWDIDSVRAKNVAEELIKGAWLTASELLGELGGYGPTHMELRIRGGRSLLGPTGQPMDLIRMGRGPLDSEPGEDMFASIERELRRATGEHVYEVSDEP